MRERFSWAKDPIGVVGAFATPEAVTLAVRWSEMTGRPLKLPYKQSACRGER
jgi:hypothetical protein